MRISFQESDSRLGLVNAYAGSKMAGVDFSEIGNYFRAFVYCDRATGSKAAAGWGVNRRRDVTFQDDSLAFLRRIGNGDGGKQCFCVWVKRVFVQIARIGYLDDLAEIHHRNAVRNVLDDGQPMRNE